MIPMQKDMQNLTAFDDFNKRLPTWIRSANKFDEDFAVRPKDSALEFAHIGTGNDFVHVMLAFDVDRNDAGASWLDAGLPPPNLIISKKYDEPNHREGFAHLVYFLKFAVTKKKDTGACRYFDSVWEGMNRALGGDPCYTMALVKNYNRTDLYHVRSPESTPYELSDLFKHIPAEFLIRNSDTNCSDFVVNGRNDKLFKALTGWARPRKNPDLPWGHWLGQVCAQAAKLNIDDLEDKEVKQIARSVAKYWFNRTEGHSAAHLKVLAEKRSIMLKALKDKTTKRQEEIAEMKQAHPELRQAELAKIFGCGIATIKRAYKAAGITTRGKAEVMEEEKVSNLYQECRAACAPAYPDARVDAPVGAFITRTGTGDQDLGGVGGFEVQPAVCFGPELDPDLVETPEWHLLAVPTNAPRRYFTPGEMLLVASRLKAGIRAIGSVGVVDALCWAFFEARPLITDLDPERLQVWRKKRPGDYPGVPRMVFHGDWPGVTRPGIAVGDIPGVRVDAGDGDVVPRLGQAQHDASLVLEAAQKVGEGRHSLVEDRPDPEYGLDGRRVPLRHLVAHDVVGVDVLAKAQKRLEIAGVNEPGG